MSQNLLQFAAHFVAAGCTLDFESKGATMSVTESPSPLRAVVTNALSDIDKYEDTRNYLDGIAALLLAETLDGKSNPLPQKFRYRVLEAVGIVNTGLFVAQELVLSLNNHAWHISAKPFSCTHFGRVCINRGIEPDPNRKGKISHRKPEEFHVLDAKQRIKREQLVSPGLKELFNKIPDRNTTRNRTNGAIDLDLRNYAKLPLEEQIEILRKIGVTA